MSPSAASGFVTSTSHSPSTPTFSALKSATTSRWGPDFRWVTVGHAGQPELQIHLTTPSGPLPDYLIEAMRQAQAEGGLPGVGLTVDDCRATYAELAAKGVEFIQEPQDRPYGVEALMRDNSGNWLVLVEPREYTAEDFEGFRPD